ncbi:hypothetical protein EK904_006149, partial [Melospiza melodia maxima]
KRLFAPYSRKNGAAKCLDLVIFSDVSTAGGAAGASPRETSRTLGLQGEKLDQLCAPTCAAEQEDVQCVMVSGVVTDPGSEDIPTQLLEIGGKK